MVSERNLSFDVAILGAGPAGCTAALRLLALGHSVAVVERRRFPRENVGESVSPGFFDVVALLGAGTALEETEVVRDLPTRVVWEDAESAVLHGPGQSAMIRRASFDTRLLALAHARGARVLQPARLARLDGAPGDWRLCLDTPDRQLEFRARLLLDATGRPGRRARDRSIVAPPTFAVWVDLPAGVFPHESAVEATLESWIWGAPLANGRHRVMAFVDSIPHAPGPRLDQRLRTLLAKSRIFCAAARAPFVGPVLTCPATPYVDREPCGAGLLRLGDAAFAIDPLSSSGVERAQRFALHVALVAHTLLRKPEAAAIATEFYEAQLVDSVATHSAWARNHYARAWPTSAFFEARRRPFDGDPHHPLVARIHETCRQRARRSLARPGHTLRERPLRSLLSAPVRVASDLRIVDTPCAVGDEIVLRPAIVHASLDRPIAFLDGIELGPLLQSVPAADSLKALLAFWGALLTPTEAARVAGWLFQRGLVETAAGVVQGV